MEKKSDYTGQLKRNIALIGMPGTFKSTMGKIIAKKIGYSFYDTDSMVEKKHKKTINEIFADEGEAVFRQYESDAVKEAASVKGSVIATGGGAVLNNNNIVELKKSCTVVHLSADVETIYTRLINAKNRPLLKDITIEKVMDLHMKRKDLYHNAMDIRVYTNRKCQKRLSEVTIQKCIAYEQERDFSNQD